MSVRLGGVCHRLHVAGGRRNFSMPVTVKLSTAEHRAWRVNKAQWVSPQGIVLRAVTAEEEKSLFPAVERTKAMGKTQSYPLVVVYRTEDPESGAIYEQKT